MNNFQYTLRKLINTSITIFLLYLIFTNFLAFIGVIMTLAAIFYFFIFKKLKKMSNGFNFQFKQGNFNQGAHNFNSNFTQQPMMNEVNDAKKFFSFVSDPSKDEIKKRYKELARKYHPDINDHDDTLMQELNHHKDVLMKTFAKI